jgi:tetratricopeptide (TPR) repeat protein
MPSDVVKLQVPVVQNPIFRRTGAMLLGLLLGSGCRPAPAPTEPHAPQSLRPPSIDLTVLDAAIVTALQEAQSEVEQTPDSAAAWGRLGQVFLAHDYLDESATCLSEAERLDPREARWPYLQAYAWRAFPARAMEPLRRAVELCGETPDAPRLRLAELLIEQGDAEEAAALCSASLRRDPQNARAQLGLARLAKRAGRLTESIELLAGPLGNTHTRKAAHGLMSELQLRLGDEAAARQHARQAAEFPVDRPWPDPFVEEIARRYVGRQAALTQAANLLGSMRGPEALVLLQQTVRTYPESSYGWLLLAKAFQLTGDLSSAEGALRRAVQLNANSLEGHFLLGVLLLERSQPADAKESFQRAISLKSDCGQAHFGLGYCLMSEGNQADAAAAFREAVRCKPFSAESHAYLAEVLLKLGQHGEARRHVALALKLQPGHTRALQLKSELPAQLAPDP